LLIEEDVSAETLIRFQNKLSKDIHTPIDIVISKFAEPIILLRARKDVKYARCDN